MSKFLIVNADDFGLCKSANEAVFDLFEQGRLLSSTIMMPCPGAKAAAEFSVAHPEYAIGVHTTLTAEWKVYRWKPLTDGKSLLDEEGFMWHESDMVEKYAKSDDIEKEVRAQINMAYMLGMKPSHIDNHMGSLYGNQTGRFGLLKLAYKICGDYKLPYRMYVEADRRVLPAGVPYFAQNASTLLSKKWAKQYNVTTPDYLLFPDWSAMDKAGVNSDSYDLYKKLILDLWTNIPDGVTETYVHPAFPTDEMKSITGRWWCRGFEYRLLSEASTWKYLADHGVNMISYRDLLKIKSKV